MESVLLPDLPQPLRLVVAALVIAHVAAVILYCACLTRDLTRGPPERIPIRKAQ